MPEQLRPATALGIQDLLFKLPREIRDQIYADTLDDNRIVGFTEDLSHYVPPDLRSHPELLSEALATFTKMNTIELDWKDLRFIASQSQKTSINPDDIRYLKIRCHEHASSLDGVSPKNLDEYEHAYRHTDSRMSWKTLLDFPRLHSLAIYMQKAEDNSLNTFDFGPILYSLRAKHPEMSITFFLSFDDLLKVYWNDPMWYNNDPSAEVLTYKPMGYIDMSELIEPPTQDDVDFVQEYLSYYAVCKMPNNRSIRQGLLDETPANRRALANHYAVKEPAMLRILMRDHYEVYRGKQDGT